MKFMKATVVLKTGQKLEIVTDEDRQYNAESFTKGTLQKFIKSGKEGSYLIQVDNIAYLETFE